MNSREYCECLIRHICILCHLLSTYWNRMLFANTRWVRALRLLRKRKIANAFATSPKIKRVSSYLIQCIRLVLATFKRRIPKLIKSNNKSISTRESVAPRLYLHLFRFYVQTHTFACMTFDIIEFTLTVYSLLHGWRTVLRSSYVLYHTNMPAHTMVLVRIFSVCVCVCSVSVSFVWVQIR